MIWTKRNVFNVKVRHIWIKWKVVVNHAQRRLFWTSKPIHAMNVRPQNTTAKQKKNVLLVLKQQCTTKKQKNVKKLFVPQTNLSTTQTMENVKLVQNYRFMIKNRKNVWETIILDFVLLKNHCTSKVKDSARHVLKERCSIHSWAIVRKRKHDW